MPCKAGNEICKRMWHVLCEYMHSECSKIRFDEEDVQTLWINSMINDEDKQQ